MIAPETFEGIVQNVWTTILGHEPHLIAVRESSIPVENLISACIHITGEYECTVIIQCSKEYALGATVTMFAMEPAEISWAEVRDVVGELANTVGGQYKSLLTGSSKLSLPSVVEGDEAPLLHERETLMQTVNFYVQNEELIFKVYERNKANAA